MPICFFKVERGIDMKIKIDDKVSVVVEHDENGLTVDILENVNAGVRAFARAYEGAKMRDEIIEPHLVPSDTSHLRKARSTHPNYDYVPVLGKPISAFIKEIATASSLSRKEIVAAVLAKGVPVEMKKKVKMMVCDVLRKDPELREKARLRKMQIALEKKEVV
jgi:hypothetical protein